MRDLKKILTLWVAFLFLLLASLFFPQDENIFGLYSSSIQFLLFLLSVVIAKRETSQKNRVIFINFAAFFSLSILIHLYNFVEVSFFVGNDFARYYYYQYVLGIAYPLFLAFAIVYLVVDLLFREFKILHKYLLTCAIVFGLGGYYYQPYFQDAKYLYSTPDIKDFKVVDNARDLFIAQHGKEPTLIELANIVELPAWKGDVPVGVLYYEARMDRVEQLYPYLPGTNYLVLLMSPLYKNIININVLVVFFLFLYFGYLYKKDPPQGAYIDKIAFLFLIFSSMEILHHWAYIKVLDWGSLTEIFNIGQYISIGIFLLMVLFFGLRLRFITSAQGEFYEHELVHSPEHITRWRDWVDNLVLSHFFNAKAIRARFFAQRGRE